MSAKLKIWRESASLIMAAKASFSQSNRFDYKILCLQRSSKSGFMPNTYVFPGGNICKSDRNTSWLKLYQNFGFSKQSFDDLQPVENIPTVLQNYEDDSLPKYLSLRICAIRETFEECGVLLCKSPKINSDTISKWASFIGGREFISWQHKVHDDPDEFLNMCIHFEIFPDVWALKNWSNWLTPASNKTSKFNAIFFIATLHQMPAVRKDEREIQDLMWTTPDECIRMSDEQTILLPVPQFYEMSRLKTVPEIDKLADFTHERSKHGFDAYWPYRVKTNEGMYTILPGDDLYPGSMDKDDTKVPQMDKLPESRCKHRILHKSHYSNFIEVEDFKPTYKHIVPTSENNVKNKL